MSELVVLQHKNLSPKLLEIVCEIKKAAWHYELEEHKKWILENINDGDVIFDIGANIGIQCVNYGLNYKF